MGSFWGGDVGYPMGEADVDGLWKPIPTPTDPKYRNPIPSVIAVIENGFSPRIFQTHYVNDI
jgi:hypothetical protein